MMPAARGLVSSLLERIRSHKSIILLVGTDLKLFGLDEILYRDSGWYLR